jgi:hypothetical protein
VIGKMPRSSLWDPAIPNGNPGLERTGNPALLSSLRPVAAVKREGTTVPRKR